MHTGESLLPQPADDINHILPTTEFIPPAPTETDTRVAELGKLVTLSEGVIEPFGTEFGVEVPDIVESINAKGPTGSKGGGNYDDYDT